MMFTMRTIIATLLCLAMAQTASAGEKMTFGCRTKAACGKVCKLVCTTKKVKVIGYGVKCDTVALPCPSKPLCKHYDSNCETGCETTCESNCEPADSCGKSLGEDGCGNDCGDSCSSSKGLHKFFNSLKGRNKACPTDCCKPCCKPCCGAKPKFDFFWRDWCPTNHAKAVSIRKLQKFVTVKEIYSYHWIVVDGCGCDSGCNSGSNSEGCDCGDVLGPDCECAYKTAPTDANLGDVFKLTQKELAKLNGTSTTNVQLASNEEEVKEVPAMVQRVAKLFNFKATTK